VQAHQRCEYCKELLFARPFYLFPCVHGFHTDCLLERVYSHHHLEPSQLKELEKIEEEMQTIRSRLISDDKRAKVKLEKLQNEFGTIIVSLSQLSVLTVCYVTGQTDILLLTARCVGS
jgi:hypothetical protein